MQNRHFTSWMIFLIVLFPTRILAQSPFQLVQKSDETSIVFSLSNVQSASAKGLSSLQVAGMQNSVEEHLPERPFVAIVVSGSVSRDDIVLEKGEAQVSSMSVRAGQGTPCRCDRDRLRSLRQVAPLDFHRDLVSVETIGIYRGQVLTRILVSPFEIDRHEVRLYADMKVTIPNAFVVDQHEFADRRHLLMVAPDTLVSGLGPLVQLRRSQGYNVEVLSFDASTDHNVLREKLQQEIRQRHEELAAVLFVGHEMILPTFYRQTKFSEQTPTDLPYIAFDGDEDWVPDTLAGRLPVMSQEELSIIMGKIIAYEQSSDQGRQRSVMGVASNEGVNPSDVEYLSSMLSPISAQSNVNTHRFHQNDPQATAQNIMQRWNAGLDWVNYIGHGSGNSWPSVTGAEFNVQHIGRITASDRNPVVIDVACQNGRFNHTQRFGESLMLKPDAGAVAYYGGTVDISWDPPALMAIGINQSLRPGEETLLGEHLLAGHQYLMKHHSNLEDVKDNYTWYHLQGDPLTRVQL